MLIVASVKLAHPEGDELNDICGEPFGLQEPILVIYRFFFQ